MMRKMVATVLLGLAIALVPGSVRGDIDEKTAIGFTAVGAVILAVVCGVTAASFGVQPGGTDEYARRGWQLGVAARYGIETFDDDLDLSIDDSLGISGLLGYRCHRHFSVEAEVEWLDGFEADVPAGLALELEPVVVTTNVKGYILTGRVQPFLLAGFGLMVADTKLRVTGLGSASESETDLATRFGGGIDIYATKRIAVDIKADYVMPVAGNDTFEYYTLSVGLMYRF